MCWWTKNSLKFKWWSKMIKSIRKEDIIKVIFQPIRNSLEFAYRSNKNRMTMRLASTSEQWSSYNADRYDSLIFLENMVGLMMDYLPYLSYFQSCCSFPDNLCHLIFWVWTSWLLFFCSMSFAKFYVSRLYHIWMLQFHIITSFANFYSFKPLVHEEKLLLTEYLC